MTAAMDAEDETLRMDDALARLVRARRDVRHFRSDPLDEEMLAQIFELAHRAPSVGLSQPWRFVRIVSADVRERLASHVDERKDDAGGNYAEGRAELYGRLKLHGLREAPVVFAAFCDEQTDKGSGLGSATMPEMLRYSCVMAIHTMWLAAAARGIGLGWVSIMDPSFVKRELAVDAEWSLLGLLCLGYPAKQFSGPELEHAGWERRSDFERHWLER